MSSSFQLRYDWQPTEHALTPGAYRAREEAKAAARAAAEANAAARRAGAR